MSKHIDNESIFFPLTDDEIVEFSLKHLQDIAKRRGVLKPTSTKYTNSSAGKIALYSEICKINKNAKSKDTSPVDDGLLAI